MDFFDKDFNIRFMYKHGKEIYSDICKMIVQEMSHPCSYEHIEIVFRIALFDFAGLDKNSIKRMLEDTMKCKIDINSMLETHKKSISEIQKYLQTSYNQANKSQK